MAFCLRATMIAVAAGVLFVVVPPVMADGICAEVQGELLLPLLPTQAPPAAAHDALVAAGMAARVESPPLQSQFTLTLTGWHTSLGGFYLQDVDVIWFDETGTALAWYAAGHWEHGTVPEGTAYGLVFHKRTPTHDGSEVPNVPQEFFLRFSDC